MIKPSYKDWTVKQIVNEMKKGLLVFDNVVQRKFCWDENKQSLLIHSMLSCFPVPPLYCKKALNEKGKPMLDALDGKQRCNSFYNFVMNGMVLKQIPEVVIENEETGEEELIDISGYTFNELPEQLQDRLLTSQTIRVFQFEDITDDEVAELFYRLNNGKPLTTVELTRAKALSRDKIISLGQHSIFKEAMSEKQIGSYANEDTVMKSLIALTQEKKSFEGADVRKVTGELEITEHMMEELNKIYDRLIGAHDAIVPVDEEGNTLDTVSKKDKKIAKRVYTRTHLISLVPITKRSLEEGVSLEDFAKYVYNFFDGSGNSTSISESYNSVVKQGSNKESSVLKRLNALEEFYNATFSNRSEVSVKEEAQQQKAVTPESDS